MLTLIAATALAQQPWQVGPAPSASSVEKGLAFAAHGGVWGEPNGGRVTAAFAPSKRFWFSGEVGQGTGWRTCPACDDVGFSGTARFLAIDGGVVKVAAWGNTVATPRDTQLSAGIAGEVVLGRVAVDTSFPLVATGNMGPVIRYAPELGARFQWSKRNATRLAVVGLDADLALTHRLRFGIFGFEATARTVAREPMVEAGVRLQL